MVIWDAGGTGPFLHSKEVFTQRIPLGYDSLQLIILPLIQEL